jgi:hypothetical protein
VTVDGVPCAAADLRGARSLRVFLRSPQGEVLSAPFTCADPTPDLAIPQDAPSTFEVWVEGKNVDGWVVVAGLALDDQGQASTTHTFQPQDKVLHVNLGASTGSTGTALLQGKQNIDSPLDLCESNWMFGGAQAWLDSSFGSSWVKIGCDGTGRVGLEVGVWTLDRFDVPLAPSSVGAPVTILLGQTSKLPFEYVSHGPNNLAYAWTFSDENGPLTCEQASIVAVVTDTFRSTCRGPNGLQGNSAIVSFHESSTFEVRAFSEDGGFYYGETTAHLYPGQKLDLDTPVRINATRQAPR